ncbi:hypothetical protein WJ438_39855 [Streptomyces sp. GD-15H]|uniref:hypothetical protein n=1 Tax=Streptomyces sp. GD-15H TaxID=3129112 RepID=UPI00324638B2
MSVGYRVHWKDCLRGYYRAETDPEELITSATNGPGYPDPDDTVTVYKRRQSGDIRPFEGMHITPEQIIETLTWAEFTARHGETT